MMMEKKEASIIKYESPKMEVTYFKAEDVIATSNGEDGGYVEFGAYNSGDSAWQ